MPDQKRKVKVPEAVNVFIINALRRSRNGRLSNGASSLMRQSHAGETLLWACSGKGTSDTILTWHIATCILDHQVSLQVSNSDHKIVATHLSRYCTYLMTWYPELLPDNDAWSKSLYEDVKKDVEDALAGGHTAARLGKQLVEIDSGEDNTAWKLLADFWSEMILFVAPSDNLKGHSEAIASGSELITLVWALLFHAGIVSRPGEDCSAANAAGVV